MALTILTLPPRRQRISNSLLQTKLNEVNGMHIQTWNAIKPRQTTATYMASQTKHCNEVTQLQLWLANKFILAIRWKIRKGNTSPHRRNQQAIDYAGNLQKSIYTTHPIYNFLIYDRLSSPYYAFVSSLSSIFVPKSTHEVLSHLGWC